MNVGVSMPLPAYLVDPAFMARTAEDLGVESYWCAPTPTSKTGMLGRGREPRHVRMEPYPATLPARWT